MKLAIFVTFLSAFHQALAFGGRYEMAFQWKSESQESYDSADKLANFMNWKHEFKKTYASIFEEGERFIIWLENWRQIMSANQEDNSYKLRMNQFSDLTGKEFAAYINGGAESCLLSDGTNLNTHGGIVKEGSPDSIDWTDVNGTSYVTDVKNQGSCGSCWAFSTTGSIESRNAIAGNGLTSLSEQQLVDCSDSYGNKGCSGGLMDDAFKYVVATGGLCSEDDYPYTGTDGTCSSSKCQFYDAISSYKDVTHDSESALVEAVAEGPVSIGIQANQLTFQFYSSGVLTGKCGTSIDHGVLVVGYGSEDGTDYWKVKNSWGTSWGLDGYILICRNCDANEGKGECGILMEPSYPVV